MNSPAPLFDSAIFNTAAFNFTNYLTKNQADQLYVSLYLMPSSAGTATASKLMITDASNSIQSINQIGFNTMNYNGTIVTSTGTELNYLHGVTPGTISAGQAVIVDALKDINGFNNITMTGELFMTGNGKDLHISGYGSKVNLSGTGSGILLSSLTSSIVTYSTLSNSISTAGGISVGGVSFQSTQAGYLSGITIGVAQASKALVLNGLGSISSINSLSTNTLSVIGTSASTSSTSGVLKLDGGLGISNSTDASSTTNGGSITIAGGMAIAKTLYVGSSISISNTLGGVMQTLVSTSNGARNGISIITDTQTWEIGARASAVSNPNTFYITNGSSTSYRLLMNSTGDTSLLSSTDSSSMTTGCLKLSGGLGVSKNIHAYQLFLHRNGSQLVLQNDDNSKSALIECPASGDLRLLSGDTSYYAVNIGASGVAISSSSRTPGMGAAFPLDFGNTAQDVIIKFYTGYFLGANNSALQFSSGGDHVFYNNGANTLGTKLATIHSSGNIISQSGCHANSFSTSGLAAYGGMAHMHYAGGIGSFITYNYGTGTWLPSQLGPQLYAVPNSDSSKTGLNVNSTSTSFLCPLQVNGSSLFTRVAGSFGYLASSGAGSAVGFTNRPFSAYFDSGLLCAANEINCFSDVRLKNSIRDVSLDTAKKLLLIDPITFRYNRQTEEDAKVHIGFRAQDFIERGLEHGVGLVELNSEEDIEAEDILCDDGRVFHLPSDMKLILNMQEIIPLLTKIVQNQEARLNEQQITIDELKSQISSLLDREQIRDQRCHMEALDEQEERAPIDCPAKVTRQSKKKIKLF